MVPLIEHILPPRVLGDYGPTPLVDVLNDFLAQNQYRVIGLEGPGCTTALRYIQAWADREGLSIATSDGSWLPTQAQALALLQLTANCQGRVDKKLRLCEWGRDEFIDYLLAYYPRECKRVMATLAHVDTHYAMGSPIVWQPYLERLAADEELIDPDQFILREIDKELQSPTELGKIADELLIPRQEKEAVEVELKWQYSDRIARWLRIEDVKRTLMARRLAEHVCNCNRAMLKRRWSGELLKQTARVLASTFDSAESLNYSLTDLASVTDFLQRSADKNRYSSTAISLLNRLVAGWKPYLQRSVDLSFADFRGAKWSGCGLRNANLLSTRLSHADLTGADLSHAVIHGTRFNRAAMSDAKLNHTDGREASFVDANLTRADLSYCQFREANFSRALLKECDFSDSDFDRVNLRGVDLRNATCNDCSFYLVSFDDAQLDGASFRGVYFKRVSFKGATLTGTNLQESIFAATTDLELMDLSGCRLAGAKLQGVYLTDSTAQNSSFKLADLSQAGLAGIVWENCDLRGADLRGAAFHMGSTRCGLVDSPFPSHGTRTGFYTDDYVDLSYKHPEQVRKAALIGCDLRGALLQGCDFYLVDVRDCQLDPDQRELMASCGAIME